MKTIKIHYTFVVCKFMTISRVYAGKKQKIKLAAIKLLAIMW